MTSANDASNHPGGFALRRAIQACASTAIGVSLAALFVLAGEGYIESRNVPPHSVKIELPLPSADHPSITDEIHEFANQLEIAYGITSQKAVSFSDWILQASSYTRVPRVIIASVIVTESSFRTQVVSSAGAIGPGQIRMRFWRDTCPYADTDPRENIICAGVILSQYYRRYCNMDWECALKLYNVGPTNYRVSPKYRAASERYYKKITGHAQQLDSNTSLLTLALGN